MEIGKYKIIESSGGGKAGKGYNKTASIQVILPYGEGCLLKKSFRYKVGSIEEKADALIFAAYWAAENQDLTALGNKSSSIRVGEEKSKTPEEAPDPDPGKYKVTGYMIGSFKGPYYGNSKPEDRFFTEIRERVEEE